MLNWPTGFIRSCNCRIPICIESSSSSTWTPVTQASAFQVAVLALGAAAGAVTFIAAILSFGIAHLAKKAPGVRGFL